MRCLTLLLLVLPSALPARALPETGMPVIGTVPRECAGPHAKRVGDRPPPRARKLGEMPPAQPIYTVLRKVDGCPIPVKVGVPPVRGG